MILIAVSLFKESVNTFSACILLLLLLLLLLLFQLFYDIIIFSWNRYIYHLFLLLPCHHVEVREHDCEETRQPNKL
jgi:hypothetical protein